MRKHARSEVDQFDAHLTFLLDQNILGFDVWMYNSHLFEKSQREQYLDGECSNILMIQRSEIVTFQ